MKIKVSIIVPFFKNFKLLKRALRSIFSQNFRYYEVIIIYDNKNKQDLSNLKKLISKKKNIKLILNKKNIGAGLSRNKGIKFASGKYICFLDSDDVWKKNKLLVQFNFMKKGNLDASHTSYDIVDINDKFIQKRNAKNQNYQKLLKSCDIGLSTVMIRREILKSKVLFPPLKTKEDFVLWLQVSKRGIIFYGIKKSLTKWTNTPNSLSKSIFQKLIDAFTVYHKYENYNFINSIYRVFILSFNFLKKK